MRTFLWVSGHVAEVQRFINVPMRWCEQYPARERRELWLTTTDGMDTKFVVHSRQMPARRGHVVIALLLGDDLVGLHNLSTGKQVNYLRSDPPLLWRRCDSVAAGAAVALGLGAFAMTGWPILLLSLLVTFVGVPVIALIRLAWRCRARPRVDRAMAEARRQAAGQPLLRRVK